MGLLVFITFCSDFILILLLIIFLIFIDGFKIFYCAASFTCNTFVDLKYSYFGVQL
jgi:hypothetical protein